MHRCLSDERDFPSLIPVKTLRSFYGPEAGKPVPKISVSFSYWLAQNSEMCYYFTCALFEHTQEVFFMAKCEVCQKDTFFGRKISITRSQVSRRALTTQQPNVRNVKVIVDGTPKTMHVCTRCLRSGEVKRA